MMRHAPSIGIGLGISLRSQGPGFLGLLDDFGGAAAAYSLRALSSAWVAGDVVEVRRSSDSTTQDFTASQITGGQMLNFVNNDTTSLYNASMYFDGVDDYVDTSLASGEVFTGFTAAMKSSALATGRSVSTRNSSGQGFILRYTVTGTKYEAVISSSAGTQVLSSGAVAGSSVMDVVATWDGTTARLYIGGSEVDSAALAGTMATSASLKIGASEVTANFFHTGVIYDVRIFDSALSPSAVGTLYDSPADGSEFAAYAGDGNNNSNWVDTSGNGYNGTVFGTPAAYTGQGFDGFVSTWYDQSGNANNATQGVTTAQPKIVDAGSLSVDVNGLPTVTYDGVDDELPFVGTGFDIGDGSTYTVCRHNVISNLDGALALSSLTNNKRWYCPLTLGGNFNFGYAASTTAIVAGTDDMDQHLFSMNAGSSVEGYQDGVSQGTTTVGSGVELAATIGVVVNNFWNGDVSEVIVYNSDQSSSVAGINANIVSKYSL
jgi:hypothetical protein